MPRKRTIQSEHFSSPEAFVKAVDQFDKITSLEMTLGPDLPAEGKFSKHLKDWTIGEMMDRMIELNATNTTIELGKDGDTPGWFQVRFTIHPENIYQKPKTWLRKLAWFAAWRIPMVMGPFASRVIDYATQGGKSSRKAKEKPDA
jgi:hypothetical protein